MAPDWTAGLEAAEAALAPWRAGGGRSPGGVVLLFDRQGVRGERSAGLASLVHEVPFDGGTPARYASVTKHVFCTFALHHGLDTDLPLGTLLPGLSPAFGSVTAGRALSMTGALPDLLQTYTLCGLPHTAAIELAALDAFCDRLDGLNGTPGTELAYSNTGYRLVERALAHRGQGFRPWIEETLNAALGTGFRFPPHWDRPLPGLAEGYWREGAGAPWRTGFYGPGLSASGALAGSARDLAAWLASLMRGDGPAGNVLQRLAAPRAMADGRPSPYALGLVHDNIAGRPLLAHAGSLPGVKNEILLDPGLDAGVIVLSNREDTDAQALAATVMAAISGAGVHQPVPPCRLPDGLYVEEDGPGWIELRDGTLTWLGTAEPLRQGATAAEALSGSPYMPVMLRAGDGLIEGEIGCAPRRFRPVSPEARLAPSLAGLWRADAHNASLVVDVAADGTGTAGFGLGPLQRMVPLTPLGGGRALMSVGAPPWPSRACLWQRDRDTLRLVLHRSRVLDYRRAG